MRRVTAKVRSFQQAIFDHVTQSTDESPATNGLQIGVQFHRPFGAGGQISNDQHCPLIADHLQCAGNWTTIKISSSHSFSLEVRKKIPGHRFKALQ